MHNAKWDQGMPLEMKEDMGCNDRGSKGGLSSLPAGFCESYRAGYGTIGAGFRMQWCRRTSRLYNGSGGVSSDGAYGFLHEI
jgi:hypothetical protein